MAGFSASFYGPTAPSTSLSPDFDLAGYINSVNDKYKGTEGGYDSLLKEVASFMDANNISTGQVADAMGMDVGEVDSLYSRAQSLMAPLSFGGSTSGSGGSTWGSSLYPTAAPSGAGYDSYSAPTAGFSMIGSAPTVSSMSLNEGQMRLNDINNMISRTGLERFWDDPSTTDANENVYGEFDTMLGSLYDSMKAIGSSGQEYDADALNSLLAGIDDSRYQLSQIMGERGAAERALRNSVLDNIASFNRVAPYADNIGITDAELQIGDELSNILSGYRNYWGDVTSDPMFFQVFQGNDWGGLEGEYFQAMDALDSQFGRRTAEEERIQQQQDAMIARLNEIYSARNNLTLADVAEANSLVRQLRDAEREARLFQSELPLDDFRNTLIPEFSYLNQDMANFFVQRAAEQQRVAQAQAGFSNLASQIYGAANSGNFYDLNAINAIEQNLKNLLSQIGSFESELPTDFSGMINAEEIQSLVDQLRSTRSDRLGSLLSSINESVGGISEIPVYDEVALNNIKTALANNRIGLSPFVGGTEVTEANALLESGGSALDAKYQELASIRASLEEQAQALMAAIQEKQFSGLSMIDPEKASADSLAEQIQLYKAQQAMDELDAIMSRLNSEKSRLQTDSDAVARRENDARLRTLGLMGTSYTPSFNNYALIDPMPVRWNSDDDARNYFARFPTNTSTFSRMLAL